MWRIGCGLGFGWEEFWCPDVGPPELEALGMLVVRWLCGRLACSRRVPARTWEGRSRHPACGSATRSHSLRLPRGRIAIARREVLTRAWTAMCPNYVAAARVSVVDDHHMCTAVSV